MSAVEIKFDCPECAKSLAIDRRAIGHKVECPFCNDLIMVPEIAEPAEVPVEPMHLKQQAPAEAASAPGVSLEELASSRPEVREEAPAAATRNDVVLSEVSADPPSQNGASTEKGGLPPRRRAGEKPKAMAEGGAPMPPPGRAGPAMPPPGPPRQMPPPPGVRKPPALSSEPAPAPPAAPAAPTLTPDGDGGVPAGFEERVRRKRKRRNPDEHRLNPREHPKMVAFDDVVDPSTFRKHPRHGKMPWWKLLGVTISILGILGGIGLGILKQMELKTPDDTSQPRELGAMEIEFEAAKKRLDAFRDAPSLEEKIGYVRFPKTTVPGYPTLNERISAYYTQYTLSPHFPNLNRASTQLVDIGESQFVKISMTNNQVQSFLYFEKSAGGIALDWDSFVGYNPVDWTEFLIQPPEEPSVFRLIVEPKNKYFGRFQDENRYASYIVTDLLSVSSAIAYVERNSPAGEVIAAEFEKLRTRDEQRILVIAEVKYDEIGVQDRSHLTEIEKVLSTSWLLP